MIGSSSVLYVKKRGVLEMEVSKTASSLETFPSFSQIDEVESFIMLIMTHIPFIE